MTGWTGMSSTPENRPDAPEKLTAQEWELFLWWGQQFKRSYSAALGQVMADWSLTRSEVDLLLFLRNHPDHNTAAALVELRGLAKSQVCASVERLTARGLLRQTRDERDRRRVRLWLTEAAEEPVSQAKRAQSTFLGGLFHGLTAKERQTLAALLSRIGENFDRAD